MEEQIPEETIPELTILDMTENPSQLPDAGYGTADDKPAGRHRKPDDGKPPPTGPPTSAEWKDFLGSVVLRLLAEGYLSLVLWREIDESELTERELNMVRLTKDDLHSMAAPMASFAAKNKTARKHGRTIIAAAESYESLVDLFIWMRRVNKIARKHRKEQPSQEGTDGNGIVHGTNGQAPEAGGIRIFNPGTG